MLKQAIHNYVRYNKARIQLKLKGLSLIADQKQSLN